MPQIKYLFYLLSPLLLSGCVSPESIPGTRVPIRSTEMIVHETILMPRTQFTIGINIVKGEHNIEENFFSYSYVKDAVYDTNRYVDAFAVAVISSVEKTDSFSGVSRGKHADYVLTATILDVSYPNTAADLTMLLNIRWSLTSNDAADELMKVELGSAGVATMDEAWNQAKRYGIGIEKASKKNIYLMLKELAKVNLR